MALEIAELEQRPCRKQQINNKFGVSMSTGEHVELYWVKEGKENPIMNTIDEDSFERHGVPAKNMHICSLILSFGIVN